MQIRFYTDPLLCVRLLQSRAGIGSGQGVLPDKTQDDFAVCAGLSSLAEALLGSAASLGSQQGMTLPAPSLWKLIYGKKAKMNRHILCLRNKGISELKSTHLRAAHASLTGTAAPSSLQLWGQEHPHSAGGSRDRQGAGGRNWQSKDLCPAQSSSHVPCSPRQFPLCSQLVPSALTGTQHCQTNRSKAPLISLSCWSHR